MGTVDATADFDADFRPATDRVSPRWQAIARAYRSGRPLPPIDVIERADGYYVLDGRHRVSVARALGHDAIDAWSSPASAGQRRLARRRHASQTDGADAHFHTGDRGRPYVCGDRHCRSPRLDVMAGR